MIVRIYEFLLVQLMHLEKRPNKTSINHYQVINSLFVGMNCSGTQQSCFPTTALRCCSIDKIKLKITDEASTIHVKLL